MSKPSKDAIYELIEQTINKPKTGDVFVEEARLKIRERCKKDLWFLNYYVLAEQTGPKETIDTQLHHDMCDRWMRRRANQFTIWQFPRIHLKTTLLTVGGNILEVLNNADIRICIWNATADKAESMVSEIISHFDDNDKLRWLFPEYCIDLSTLLMRKKKKCKWGAQRVDFPCGRRIGRREGNIECASIESSKVSKHYNLQHFDDLEDKDNVGTKSYRDKVYDSAIHALQLRDNPNTSIMRFIGTPWHVDGVQTRLIKKEREARARGEKPNYLIYRRPIEEKHPDTGSLVPIWPERFTPEVISRLRIDNGEYVFNCQYMLDPNPESKAIFKMSKIRLIDMVDVPDNLVHFAAVDLAQDDTVGDFTVITVAGFDEEGNMYVKYVYRDKIFPFDLIENVRKVCQMWNIKEIAIERTGFQASIIKYYKNYALAKQFYIPWVEMERARKVKWQRIIALEPLVNASKFHILRGIDNIEHALEEMTGFRATDDSVEHDDILDTLADIWQIYYSAPKAPIDTRAQPGSIDAIFGSLEDSNGELSGAVGGAFIGRD